MRTFNNINLNSRLKLLIWRKNGMFDAVIYFSLSFIIKTKQYDYISFYLTELFPILILIFSHKILEKLSKRKEIRIICQFLLNIYSLVSFNTSNNIYMIYLLRILIIVVVYDKMNG